MPRNFSIFINLLFLTLCTSWVAAKDYKIEVLVFENSGAQQAYESYRYPDIDEQISHSQIWQLEPTLLNSQAELLTGASQHCLLHHFSWGQESLPYSKTATVNLAEQGLNGWVKVYANHLLYANINMDFDGYRMIEKRRLKLNDKHFFDHPKFGVLMQVSRLESESLDTLPQYELKTAQRSSNEKPLYREDEQFESGISAGIESEIRNHAVDKLVATPRNTGCINRRIRPHDTQEPKF